MIELKQREVDGKWIRWEKTGADREWTITGVYDWLIEIV